MPNGASLAPPALATALQRAEAHGKQVLYYTPHGMLGGTFVCARCGATAIQPDLLAHALACPYAAGPTL